MAGSRYLIPTVQYMDEAGRPAVGFKLNTYLAGGTTPAATYSDAALSVANTNPIVADSEGYVGTIYTDPDTAMKYVWTKADDTVIWTQDNVYSGVGSEAIETGNIADGAVTGVKIAAAVAGDGLGKDGSSNLEVKVDDSSIEISSDALQVKALGVTGAMLETGIAAVNVSSDDTTEGYLDGKLVAGNNITLTVGSPAGNETLTIDTAFRGASAYITSGSQVVADGASDDLAWTNVNEDTSSFFDLVTDDTKITIPANVDRVRFVLQLYLDPAAVADCDWTISLNKDGTGGYVGKLFVTSRRDRSAPYDVDVVNLVSPALSVSAGEEFQVNVAWDDNVGAAGLSVVGNSAGTTTWISVEVIE